MESGYGIFWGDNLFPKVIEKVAIIDNFLYESDIMCIKSKEGVGKSILAQQIVFALTSGDALLDTYNVSHPCNVLWIQTEGDREETFERITNMEKALHVDHKRWAHLYLPGASMNTPRGMHEIIKEIKKPDINWDVIIIDPLYTTIQGKLTEDCTAADWAREVRSMRDMFGKCALIILHHDNKAFYHQGEEVHRNEGDVFGAFGWGAFFNTVYKFSVKGGMHTLVCGKDRGAKVAKKIDMKLIEPTPLLFSTDEKHLTVGSALVEKYIRDHDNVTRRELLKNIQEVSEITIDRAIKKFKDNKRLVTERKDGQHVYKWL